MVVNEKTRDVPLFANARAKGVKIYSDSDIAQAKGDDAVRLPFWNNMVNQLYVRRTHH